ncbi:MAG: ABC transporter ATP-binding protein [Candidatus Dormibacteraceae bacterium]
MADRRSGRRAPRAPRAPRESHEAPRPPAVFDANKLVRDYGSTRALGPITLSVADGEVVALLGPNGAGKSTLLSIAAGLLDATSGEVAVCGGRPGSMLARRQVSYVPDTPVLYDDLSIGETAEFVARLHGAPNWKQRLDELLERFDLEDRADSLPSTLSRGLRQRAGLVIGLVRPFRLLLLDEPFATLDQASMDLVGQVLAEEAAKGGAILLASHQHDSLPENCRLVQLAEGRIVRARA